MRKIWSLVNVVSQLISYLTVMHRINKSNLQEDELSRSLTKFPTDSTLLNCSVMGQCSMAMKSVFNTMQMVIARSTNGSITTRLTTCFTFSHGLQQSQIRHILANLYQQGGHFCLDSSSSGEEKKINTLINPFYFLFISLWFKLQQFFNKQSKCTFKR